LRMNGAEAIGWEAFLPFMGIDEILGQ